MHSGLYYRQRPRGNLLSAMSLILFVLLQVVATQYVAFALPAPGTASTSVDTLPSQSSTCNDIHHCRTLISLVWSCLTTIFLCTWITVHLDVKEEGETSWTSRFLNRISSVCMMLFAPEMYALNSITEWADACNLVETLSIRYPNIPWTETHGMMAVMNGFEVVKEDDANKICLNYENFETELEGYEVDFSVIPKDVIMDKSKGDVIAKVLVVLQTSWFAIQCVARGLPVTELELTTLGHTAYVSVVYFFWWNKPLGVVYPLTLQAKRRLKDGSDDMMGGVRAQMNDGDVNGGLELHTPLITTSTPTDPSACCCLSWRIRSGLYASSKSWHSRLISNIFAVLISGIFGAIHRLAWHSYFPSYVELLLWRISALIVTVMPTMLVVISAMPYLGDRETLMKSMLYGSASTYLVSPYICARIGLMMLCFLALRQLPFAAYQTPSWTNFIPHL